jgi:hypothetical protein
MGDRVAIIIPNGGMSEVTHTLCEHVERNTKSLYDLVVVNNPLGDYFGPNTLDYVSPLGMTQAIIKGLEYISNNLHDIFAYWLITTSIEFMFDEDYLTPMLNCMIARPEVVMVSPATNDMAWDSMKQNPTRTHRNTWGVDNVCLLIRKDWFDSVGWYDPDLKMGWGTTLETCWKARRDNKKIVVMDHLMIKWNDGIAHKMGRRQGVDRATHNRFASEEMASVLGQKYGGAWLKKMTTEYLENV